MLGGQGVPGEFLKQVHDALAHLFDIAYLQRHPLAAILVPADVADPKARAQLLRERLLEAIGDLKPPPNVSPRELAYRPYGILRHRFVEGLTPEEVQERLSLSRRQYFREQQRACEAVASILWQRRLVQAEEEVAGQSFHQELEELGLQPQTFSLQACLEQALAALRPLADRRGVALSCECEQVTAFADPVVTRQALISLLSALVQLGECAYYELRLHSDDRWAILTVSGLPPAALEAAGEGEELLQARRLAERAGGQLFLVPDKGLAQLRLPSAREELVVIVDDNPKTLQLFQRYLSPYRYRLALVQQSVEALQCIRKLQPDIVVLDVMMRDVDGWQILQTIKTDPQTRHIPVIVCTVLAEEALARTIGAEGYLRKPVTQTDLVLALARVRKAADALP
jgi:CheY-like chemotaxis protein